MFSVAARYIENVKAKTGRQRGASSSPAAMQGIARSAQRAEGGERDGRTK